jgi:integral membrane protein
VSTYPQTMAKPKQIRSALSTYRVLATVAGFALFVLILEMVMKYALKQTNLLTQYWSPVHGIIYFAYAVSVANLGLKAAWGPVRIVKNLLAGFVPVVPWIAERRNTAQTEALLSRAYLAADGTSSEGPTPGR